MNGKPNFTVISSRAFNHDTAGAKRSAKRGPVIITDRGEPAYVLITKAEFDRLEKGIDDKKPFKSLADALADTSPEGDFDFEVPEFKGVFKGYEFED